MWPCHAGNTSSHFNTTLKLHWIWAVRDLETSWGLLVLLAWVWISMLVEASGHHQILASRRRLSCSAGVCLT